MTTPTCPACGAKFAHSNAMQWCLKCKLPDEVALQGPQAIRRWLREADRQAGITKRQHKQQVTPIGGSAGRRRNKHGRRGVAR